MLILYLGVCKRRCCIFSAHFPITFIIRTWVLYFVSFNSKGILHLNYRTSKSGYLRFFYMLSTLILTFFRPNWVFVGQKYTMEESAILFSSFFILVGQWVVAPDSSKYEYERELLELQWTRNPLLRVVYGKCCILGWIIVFGSLIYLMFTSHWWYIGIYIVGLYIAKLLAFIIKLLLTPFYIRVHNMYADVLVQRVAGIIIIIIGMALLLVL